MRYSKNQISLILGGILIMLTQLSISANCFSIFIIPICENLGFARGIYSWTQSFLFLGGAISAFMSGKIFERFGIVRTMRVSAIISTLLYFLQSFASSIPMFFLINLGIGFCNSLSTSMPLSLLIGERFLEKRNTIIGIVMTGSGFGTSLFNSLASNFILEMGWRRAMMLLSLIMAVISLSSCFLLIKALPEKKREKTLENKVSVSFFKGKRIIIGLMCIAISLAGGSFMYTITPHLQDIGYSQSFAASVYSISMLFMAAGKIFHGLIIDRFGVRVSNSVMIFTAMIGLFGALHFRSIFDAALICIGMMFISSLSVVGGPALAEALGGEEYKKYFLGKITTCISLGYTIAPFIYGFVYDKKGSYVPMYIAALIIFVICLIGVLVLLPSKKALAK